MEKELKRLPLGAVWCDMSIVIGAESQLFMIRKRILELINESYNAC